MALEDFVNAEIETRDFIISEEDENGYSFQKINVDPDVLDILEERALQTVEKQKSKIEEENAELTEYSSSNQVKEQNFVQKIPVEETPNHSRLDQLRDERDLDTKRFDEADPDFQFVRLKNGEGIQGIAVRKFTQRQVVKSKDWPLIFREGHYKKVDEDLVTLPNKFDFIITEGEIFVFRPKSFEQFFDFMDEFEEAAEDVSEDLQEADITLGKEDEILEKIKSNESVLRKMHGVKEREYYKDMDMEDMKRRITEYDIEGVTIEEDSNGNDALFVTDYRKIWGLIRLLNDDYTVSDVTDNKYEIEGEKEER